MYSIFFHLKGDLVSFVQRKGTPDLRRNRDLPLAGDNRCMFVVVPESWTTLLVGMMLSKEGDTTMQQRRSFTPQFKTRVVREVLTKRKTMAQVCRDYDLTEQVVTRWKAEFLARAPTRFAPDQHRDAAQTRIAELERLVGRLTLELAIAQKAAQLLTSPGTSNGR